MTSQLHIYSIWHRAFVRHLEYAVGDFEGIHLTQEQAGDPTHCKLGQWIKEHFDELSECLNFHELIDCHNNFHVLSMNLAEKINKGITASNLSEDFAKLNLASEFIIYSKEQLESECHISKAGLFLGKTSSSSWSDSLKIGNPIIDGQHKEIANLIDLMLSTPDLLISSETGADSIHKFIKLITNHCKTEELFINRSSMSDAVKKMYFDEHTRLLDKANNILLIDELRTVRRTMKDISPFLTDEILGHVVDYDLFLNL